MLTHMKGDLPRIPTYAGVESLLMWIEMLLLLLLLLSIEGRNGLLVLVP
jgi:hypothetical protein